MILSSSTSSGALSGTTCGPGREFCRQLFANPDVTGVGATSSRPIFTSTHVEESIMTWADLTRGTDGRHFTVKEGFDEIPNRYPEDSQSVVGRHIRASLTHLLHAA